jgi:hypothetical protein
MVEVQVERGSRGLGGRPVEDGGDTCRVVGDAFGVCYSRTVWASKPSGGRIYGFRPQNLGRDSEEEQMARGGIKKFALRRSYLMKGAVVVR